MYLLALDTTTDGGGVALARDGKVVDEVFLEAPLRSQENVLPMVDVLLGRHGLRLEDLELFVAATGPGSFTGLRIGLATVKAFCQVLSRPAVGVSTLEALAWRFRHVHSSVAPVIDARRRQVFGGLYLLDGERIRLGAPEIVAFPRDWIRGLPPGDLLLVGDGVRLYRDLFQEARPGVRVLESDNRLLSELCGLGFRRFSEGLAVPAALLRANYIRPSDAELARARKPGDPAPPG